MMRSWGQRYVLLERLQNISVLGHESNKLVFIDVLLGPKYTRHHISGFNVSTGFLNELFVQLVEGETQVKVIKSFSY